jgi:hypothetical protein
VSAFIVVVGTPIQASVGADAAVIQLATKCASADEFVERFARFTTQTDVVVPAVPNAAVGTAGRFAIRLKDQAVIMSGRCEVSEVTAVTVPPGAPARALMRLRLLDMDAKSRGIHLRLLERGASAAAKPARPNAGRTPSDSTPPPRPTAERAPPDSTPPPRPPAERVPPRRISAPALALVRSPAAAARPSAKVPPPAMARQSAPPPAMATKPTGVAAAAATKLAPKVTATMVGVPMPALAPAKAAPPPAALAPTLVAPAPQPAARAPGAAFTLPANPLSDLDGADLASFIELQLLETDGGASTVGSSVPGEDLVVDEAVSPPAAARPATILKPVDGRARALRMARHVAPFAACAVGGLLLGMALRPATKPRRVAPPVIAAPAVVVAAPAPPPEVVPAPVVAAPTDAPAPSAPAGCLARVTTKPAGATVSWGEIALGTTPIAHAPVPCGPAVVTVSHDRYQDVTRSITATPGESAVVDARLARPRATALVTSSPPQALIKVNGRPIGSAGPSAARPRKVALMRFETVRVEASLPGYQRWTRSLYLKEAETKIDVTLVPVAKKETKKDRRR